MPDGAPAALGPKDIGASDIDDDIDDDIDVEEFFDEEPTEPKVEPKNSKEPKPTDESGRRLVGKTRLFAVGRRLQAPKNAKAIASTRGRSSKPKQRSKTGTDSSYTGYTLHMAM